MVNIYIIFFYKYTCTSKANGRPSRIGVSLVYMCDLRRDGIWIRWRYTQLQYDCTSAAVRMYVCLYVHAFVCRFLFVCCQMNLYSVLRRQVRLKHAIFHKNESYYALYRTHCWYHVFNLTRPVFFFSWYIVQSFSTSVVTSTTLRLIGQSLNQPIYSKFFWLMNSLMLSIKFGHIHFIPST